MRKSNFFGQLFVRIGYEQKNRYASKRCFSTQQKKGRDFFQMSKRFTDQEMVARCAKYKWNGQGVIEERRSLRNM